MRMPFLFNILKRKIFSSAVAAILVFASLSFGQVLQNPPIFVGSNAEGDAINWALTKIANAARTKPSSALISEFKDFLNSLRALGISDAKLKTVTHVLYEVELNALEVGDAHFK